MLCFVQIDPIEYVEDICENMQLFPKEDLLTGDQLMFEYDPEVSFLMCQEHAAKNVICHWLIFFISVEWNCSFLYFLYHCCLLLCKGIDRRELDLAVCLCM